MLKDSIGGTEGAVAKRAEARRIVPSPPKAAVKSTFWVKREESFTPFGSMVVSRGFVYRGKGNRVWSSNAGAGSRMKDTEG